MDDTFYFLFPQCIFLFIFRECVLTLKKIRKLQRGWKSGSAARAAPGQQGARGARAGPLTPRGLTGPRTPWAAGRARRCGRPNSLSCRPEARAARAAVLQVRPRRKARPDGAGCERASSALRTARADPRRGATAPRCSAVRRGRGPDVRRAGGVPALGRLWWRRHATSPRLLKEMEAGGRTKGRPGQVALREVGG